jgi:hypothetical protein
MTIYQVTLKMREYSTFLKESQIVVIATNLLFRGLSALLIFIMENVNVYDRTYLKKFNLHKYMTLLTCSFFYMIN